MPLLAHRVAQRLDPRIGVLRLARIFGIGKAIVPAGQPRIFIDHRCKPFGGLVIGALPQRAESARRADDRQIADAVGGRDFAQLVGHSGAAGDAGDQALGAFENAVQHALRAAHFPQHVDVDRALARRHFIGALDLRDGAVDGIFDQLFVAVAARQRLIDLRDDPAFGIVAVGVDRADRADAAGRRPGARAGMVGGARRPCRLRPAATLRGRHRGWAAGP